ncbi:MAG: hypothetical protein IKC11_03370 [Clostridia bacterium]|nr:hypothetical protein [Clostridia bacterium]
MENLEKVEKLINLALNKNIFDFDNPESEENQNFGSLNKPIQISITGFQRVLGIGFPTAKELMDYLIENDAVTESNGRYFVIAFDKYITALATHFNTLAPEDIYINSRPNEIEESMKASDFYIQRLNNRNKYFKKKGNYSLTLVPDLRTLLEKHTVFNIEKDKILAFYDANKKQIFNLFNLNSKMLEDDSKFMHGLDYDERICVNKNGQVSSYIKIYPTYKKDQEAECLCLLCIIIKLLWNKQNKEKIYMYKMYKYSGFSGEEINDYYISDICINDGENSLPF